MCLLSSFCRNHPFGRILRYPKVRSNPQEQSSFWILWAFDCFPDEDLLFIHNQRSQKEKKKHNQIKFLVLKCIVQRND